MSTVISNADPSPEPGGSIQESYENELRENASIKVSYRGWSIESHAFYLIIAGAIYAITHLAQGGYPCIGPGIIFVFLAALAHPCIRLDGYTTPQRRPARKSA